MKADAIKKTGFGSLFSGLLPLFVFAHFGHHLLTALPVPLLPMIRSDFALDYTQSGLVISAFNLSYGIGQLPAGWLADRIGRRVLITMGICGVAVAGLLVGLSQSYIMMIIFLALMGLLGGGYHPSSPPAISASVEPHNRGRALGLHLIGGSGSYFLSPLIAAGIAAFWGWRGSFITLAVPTMAFGIIFFWLLGRLADTKKVERSTAISDSKASTSSDSMSRLVVFIALTTFTGAIFFSTISFIPLFVVDRFGVAKETAAALISLIYFSGLWASPLGGYLSDRLGRVPMILAICFTAGPLIYGLNLIPYAWGIPILLLVIGINTSMRMPVSESYIVGQAPPQYLSTVLGIYYFSSMEGGGVLTPVMGYLIDKLGFYPSFTIAGAALIVMTLVCSIWLWGSHD